MISNKDAQHAHDVSTKLAMGDHVPTRALKRALPVMEEWKSEWLEPADDPKESVMRDMARFGMNLTISKIRDILGARNAL